MAVSVWDWRNWRYEETKNYGHGPLESLALPQELAIRYVNEYAGIRMRYPGGWMVVEKLKDIAKTAEMAESFKPSKLTEVAVITNPGGEVEVKVGVDRTQADLVTALEEQVKGVTGRGIEMAREREYLNTEREDWGIITWEVGERTVRRAVAVFDGRMAVVEASFPTTSLDQYIRTGDEIVKSVKMTI